eukprot:CAMPEP_0116141746 /NCGR_PEP_ID=MMETSP0329-20121206/14542_1 /TAXON_ID=697910 /ORGANISM="Pseudo-nitzschia arenysensis, Strain B593" /LENGTH=461 /DNA_ID=CAMNT_0003636941 /DNA_START=100 /DNA_END=1485 /DNA_ORIENTATION=+
MATSKTISNQMDASRPNVPNMKRSVPTKNITVEVSGSRFCIVPSLFKHIENFPWKERKNKPPKLYANPDLFESVLQYFLSSKLPEPTSLSPKKAKTLIEFVSPLDEVAVKPLVDYLQTFVDKTSTDKSSFKRRGFPTISTPFSPLRSKSSKGTKTANADNSVKQSASHASSVKNNRQPNNSISGRRTVPDSERSAPPSIASPIPTHIEHPVTTSTMTAEISVCSMDESSVSKLSVHSSPSNVPKQQPARKHNEITVLQSSSSSTLSVNHQMQAQNQFQHYHKQNRLTFEGTHTGTMNQTQSTQSPGFSVDCQVEPRNPFDALPSVYNPVKSGNPFDTPYIYNSSFPTMVQSLETNFNDQYRQHHTQPVAKANDPVHFPKTHNFMAGMNSDHVKQNSSNLPSNPSDSKPKSTTKILRTVLGGNEKKSTGTTTTVNNVTRNLFRKQEKMTHAEWCASASEYIC